MTGVGRLHALRTEQVLHAIRHALQRQQLVLRPRLVSSVSGSKRMIRRFNDEGIERLGGGNIRIECVGHFTGSEFALAEAIADCRDGKIGQPSGHYSITFATATKPCSPRGPFPRTFPPPFPPPSTPSPTPPPPGTPTLPPPLPPPP